MDTIQKKIDQAKSKEYRGKVVGVPIGVRIPPLILEGVLAYMKENGTTSMTDAITELLQEGLISASIK
jgi:hypothetical protein